MAQVRAAVMTTCDFLGVRDHDDVGGTFDVRDLRAHALVAEPADAELDTPVRGRQHRPDRAITPRGGRRRLGQRDTGERPLRDRVERGVIGRDVGADDSWKPLGASVKSLPPSVNLCSTT